MSTVARSIGAVLAGAIAGVLLISAVELAGGRFFPPPAGLDVGNREAMARYIATLPLGAFLLLLLGYGLGGFGGGYTAARMAPAAPGKHAIAISVLLVLASVMNLLSFPHPAWFWVANLLVVALMPMVGARVAGVR